MRILLPNDGDERIIRRFAMLPVTIGKEIRWFEFVYIKQHYSDFYGKWISDRFADKDQWKIYKI